MLITNAHDILSFINSKLSESSKNSLNSELSETVSNVAFKSSAAIYPIISKNELRNNLFIAIHYFDADDNIKLSVNYRKSDNSEAMENAKDVFNNIIKNVSIPLIKDPSNSNTYYYDVDIQSIESAVKHMTNFISQINDAAKQAIPQKKSTINWDNIVGMTEGTTVYLTDNGRYDVIDNFGRPVTAKYIGGNKLKCQCVEGSSSRLAILFINTYGKRKNKTYSENGNECWTFNGTKIIDCPQIDTIAIPAKKAINETAKKQSAASPVVKKSEYIDTFTSNISKNDANGQPFSFIDSVSVMTSRAVNNENKPSYFMVKKGGKFHEKCIHAEADNNANRMINLGKLVNAGILAAKCTDEGIVYTFTRDITSIEISEVVNNFSLNMLATFMGVSINVWTADKNYYHNNKGEHISKFYRKNYKG